MYETPRFAQEDSPFLDCVECSVFAHRICKSTTTTSTKQQRGGNRSRATKLATPVYPQLARMANIWGEVKVTASIRKDGSIKSAEATTGHHVLKQAALESIHKSTFECRGCTEVGATELLTFSYELRDDGDCCAAWSRPAEVTQSHDRIIIVAPHSCLCDPAFTTSRRVRSLKCLYLWRCGSR